MLTTLQILDVITQNLSVLEFLKDEIGALS